MELYNKISLADLQRDAPFVSRRSLSYVFFICQTRLTHWGRVTHIYVSKLTIISSDNGLSPGRCQAILWTNAGILLIRNLGTNFSEILSKIHAFSFKKMHLKMSSGKRRPSCLGLNVLNRNGLILDIGQISISDFPIRLPWILLKSLLMENKGPLPYISNAMASDTLVMQRTWGAFQKRWQVLKSKSS